ncbi:hypothetical protein [Kribbella catacumbae]|uniref:hypothetical protein n=1 Tax=Kribbella catacumbae TaxID=460086 RepID=UPI0012FBB018|nr:hypothetical protein [Kribbella catacumbae]
MSIRSSNDRTEVRRRDPFFIVSAGDYIGCDAVALPLYFRLSGTEALLHGRRTLTAPGSQQFVSRSAALKLVPVLRIR